MYIQLRKPVTLLGKHYPKGTSLRVITGKLGLRRAEVNVVPVREPPAGSTRVRPGMKIHPLLFMVLQLTDAF